MAFVYYGIKALEKELHRIQKQIKRVLRQEEAETQHAQEVGAQGTSYHSLPAQPVHSVKLPSVDCSRYKQLLDKEVKKYRDNFRIVKAKDGSLWLYYGSYYIFYLNPPSKDLSGFIWGNIMPHIGGFSMFFDEAYNALKDVPALVNMLNTRCSNLPVLASGVTGVEKQEFSQRYMVCNDIYEKLKRAYNIAQKVMKVYGDAAKFCQYESNGCKYIGLLEFLAEKGYESAKRRLSSVMKRICAIYRGANIILKVWPDVEKTYKEVMEKVKKARQLVAEYKKLEALLSRVYNDAKKNFVEYGKLIDAARGLATFLMPGLYRMTRCNECDRGRYKDIAIGVVYCFKCAREKYPRPECSKIPRFFIEHSLRKADELANAAVHARTVLEDILREEKELEDKASQLLSKIDSVGFPVAKSLRSRVKFVEHSARQLEASTRAVVKAANKYEKLAKDVKSYLGSCQ